MYKGKLPESESLTDLLGDHVSSVDNKHDWTYKL